MLRPLPLSLTSQDDQKTDDNIAIKLQLDENELIFDSNAGQWYSGIEFILVSSNHVTVKCLQAQSK